MEKFGLFRLLSALTGEAAPEKEPETQSAEGAEPQNALADRAESGVFTGEERRLRAERILARHEAISRRIDRRGGKT